MSWLPGRNAVDPERDAHQADHSQAGGDEPEHGSVIRSFPAPRRELLQERGHRPRGPVPAVQSPPEVDRGRSGPPVVPAPRCGHAAGVNRLAVLAALTVVVVGALTVACAVFGPDWIVRHDLGAGGRSALSVGDRRRAVNDVRATLLQGLAAVVALGGVGLGAVMTLRQIRVHREGQFIDRFTKAIEQPSSDHVLMRMGGVYAMEQIADVAPHYRGHIAALLASYVRQQAPWPPSRPLPEVDVERRRYHGGLRDDIGGAMAALSRRAMILPGTGIELEDAAGVSADLMRPTLAVDHDTARTHGEAEPHP
jgi:hypothetical protein